MEYLLLIVSLGMILIAAEVFTNGVEWLGIRLRLAEGAVGSILAAVGTALPESLIPLIAFIFGKGTQEQHIGIGAIIGAPFMLSTLAFFISGLVVVLDRRRRFHFPALAVEAGVIRRDLVFFFCGYTLGLGAAFIEPAYVKKIIAAILLVLYSFYVFLTLRGGKTIEQSSELRPLIISGSKGRPRLLLILLQIVLSLLLLVSGAELFIKNVEAISMMLGVPSFFLSLIIAPIATELPEKFNSIIWLKQHKDTLAIGNITGAMVFQSVVLPSIGIFFTDWRFVSGSEVPILMTYASVILAYLSLKIRKRLNAYVLLAGAVFYLFFLWTTLH
ncbi:MAG: sodium:calcium antiporter [Thermacetogeniaceae bacterium]